MGATININNIYITNYDYVDTSLSKNLEWLQDLKINGIIYLNNLYTNQTFPLDLLYSVTDNITDILNRIKLSVSNWVGFTVNKSSDSYLDVTTYYDGLNQIDLSINKFGSNIIVGESLFSTFFNVIFNNDTLSIFLDNDGTMFGSEEIGSKDNPYNIGFVFVNRLYTLGSDIISTNSIYINFDNPSASAYLCPNATIYNSSTGKEVDLNSSIRPTESISFII